MTNIMGIIHELRRARGTNQKLKILKEHSGNHPWRQFLMATYDTSLNYYVGSPMDFTFTDVDDYTSMFVGLSNLVSKKYRGNAARQYAKELSQEYGEPLRLVLGGSVKAGVSTTTINKAYPGLIPEFKVMLAKDVPVPRFPVWAFTKYDGVRALIHADGSATQVYLRSGKELNLTSLIEEGSYLEPGWYDGELVKGSGLQNDRTRITGDVNKVLKGSTDEIDNYTFQCFDMVAPVAWSLQECLTPYRERLARLGAVGDHIKLASRVILRDQQEVDDLFNDLISRGYEGLILRYPEDKYEWKRSTSLIKKKATKECILRCVEVIPGTGKYEGMVGSLRCEGKLLANDIVVKVGTGLSDFDRDQPFDYYVGKDIEIMYNEVVSAKNKTTCSLFLPRFKRVLGNTSI